MEYTEYFVQIRDNRLKDVVATFGNRRSMTNVEYLASWLYERLSYNRTYIFDESNDCLYCDKIWLDNAIYSDYSLLFEMLDGLTLEIMKNKHIDDDDASEKKEFVKYYSIGRNKC